MSSKPTPTPTITPSQKSFTPKPPLNPQERRRCYKCQGFGHIALECSNRRVMTMAECQAIEEVEWEEEKNDNEVHLMEVKEECVEVVDKGELLVLRRALSGKTPNLEEQRENIFHTRCTIHRRVCSLIVDGGSCANWPPLLWWISSNSSPSPIHDPTPLNGLIKVRESKSLQHVLFHSPLVRTMQMHLGVTFFQWMLVICCLGDHGCLTERSIMMDT